MGAQSALLGLVNSVTGATSSAIASGLKNVSNDQTMADYSRQMRDAKLATAKNNAAMSKIRLEKMKKVTGGEK